MERKLSDSSIKTFVSKNKTVLSSIISRLYILRTSISVFLIVFGIVLSIIYSTREDQKENMKFIKNVWIGKNPEILVKIFWIWIFTFIFLVFLPFIKKYITESV
jgi:hypothetical protein